jgi:hypothetical protein
MGVYVDYTLRAEGLDEVVQSRLERVRQRCLDLPLERVGDVQHIEPIYGSITFSLYNQNGLTLPAEVALRYNEAEADPQHWERCFSFGMFPGRNLPDAEVTRYIAPVLEFIANTEFWRSEDLPETLGQSAFGFDTFKMSRAAIELDFASLWIRHGYLLVIDPGKGSETVKLGLSTYRLQQHRAETELPLWHGDSFTKTQYAENFVHVHETVCKVLDIVKEEGLLLEASDTCGYYASRSWAEAGRAVNEENAFAKVMSGIIDVGIGNLREEGVGVKVLVDNASKAKQVDFSEAMAREEKKNSKD